MASDVWAVGEAYEPYVGRWSRLVAQRFLPWLSVPAGARWVDVGCGTGVVTRTVLEHGSPAEVVGIDPSAAFLAYAQRTVTDPRARFEEGDATALPLPDGQADAVVSGLVLNFVAEPERAAAEMARVARTGATVGAYVWDYAEGMQLMRYFWNAAAETDDRAQEMAEGRRFPLCRPEPLRVLFTDAGLAEVLVEPIDVPTTFRDFDDYWTPFLGGQGPAPSYTMALPEDARAQLRERLRAALPYAADGSIPLTARAWAVRGRRD